MSLFPVDSGGALLTDSAVVATDVSKDGFIQSTEQYVRATVTGAVANHSQGVPVSSDGLVCVTDGAVATYSNGLPLSSDGRLCVSGSGASTFTNGLPMASDGKLYSLTAALLAIFRRPGVEAHAYIPGIGTIGGLALQNFIESNGTVAAAVDNPLGYLGDASGDTPVINATQPTTANKPILRRGHVNRLLNSVTLSTQTRTVNALPYTLSFTGTGTVTLSGASTAGPLVGTGVSNRVSLTFTPTAGSLTLTVTGTVTDAQLETGSTANTYVPTTTAAASASTGPFWAEYDGTDSLTLAAVPFQVQDDACVVFAAQANGTANQTFVSFRSIAAPSAGSISIGYEGTNTRWISQSNDGTTATFTVHSNGSTPVGALRLISWRKVGNARTLRANAGLLTTTSTATLTTSAIPNAEIGRDASGAFAQVIGGIYPLIAIKGTITDAELSTIERWVAQQSGVTL